MNKVNILSAAITTGSYGQLLDQLFSLARQPEAAYVCFSNVHMVIEAQRDPMFRTILNQADMAVPDGMPVAKAVNLLHGQEQDRFAGMDIVPETFSRSEKEGLSVFFYGDTQQTLDRLCEKVTAEFPQLKIAGAISPPFRKLSEEEQQELINQINDARPDFLMVALGCPKQEKWMAAHKEQLSTCMLGIGNALRTYLGDEERAPEWMQKASLEWLHRLIQNPKRLWKRYLVTNSWFVGLLILAIAKRYMGTVFVSQKLSSS
ncbi:MAG: WecB/TagA/CpsF family glycosyltransferase [Bacteroidota bacterium]